MDDTTPVGYSLTLKPKERKRKSEGRYRTHRRCNHVAPCGSGCVLNGNVYHVYHTCKNGECAYCHGDRFRYAEGVRRLPR